MGQLEEQFIELYKSVPKAMAPVDLMRNVRELMSRHGINSTQAMSMSYAIAVQNPELEDGTKECFKRFLRPAEVEEATKYQELLQTLGEKAEFSSPSGFKAKYLVYITPWGQPPEYNSEYKQMTFADGDREAYNSFKTRVQRSSELNGILQGIFRKKSASEEEVFEMLRQELADKGFSGTLVSVNTATAKRRQTDLEPEMEPDKEVVPADSEIRRDAVDNGSEYIDALAELDALTGRAPVMAESQRPDITTVISGMEEDLKKAVLVRLAEMFRGLGYEEWPTDEVGEKDMKNVMEAVSKGLKDMSGRMSELISGQIDAIKAGPEKYTENLSRWLAGQSAIVDEEEDEEEVDTKDKQKECGDAETVAPEVSEPAPEETPEEVPEREPEVAWESKKVRK
jgi:hypothetical protein